MCPSRWYLEGCILRGWLGLMGVCDPLLWSWEQGIEQAPGPGISQAGGCQHSTLLAVCSPGFSA